MASKVGLRPAAVFSNNLWQNLLLFLPANALGI
jgi:hypothetical protein